MRLLLVEDNAADQRLIQIVLGEKVPDWSIEFSSTLKGALAFAPFERFDCVVADLGLPDARGIEVVHALRAKAPDMALVVLTALDDDVTAREAIRAGAQDYLIKSDSGLDHLQRTVEYAIERQKTHRALELARMTSQALLDGSQDDIALLDCKGRVVALNVHAARSLGRDAADAVGLDWIGLAPAGLATERARQLTDVIASGLAQRFEEIDGNRWYNHLLRPIAGPLPGEIFVASFVRDVSDEKYSAQQLAEVKLQAELANRAKTDFMARMSRDIRTPLNDVIGFAEMIVQEMLGPITPLPYGEYAEAIHNSGRQILKVIDQITDVSMLESALLQDEASYRDLVELSPDLICVCVDGVVELINAAGTGLLRGSSPDIFVGRRFTELVQNDYVSVFDDNFQTLIDERRPIPVKMVTVGNRTRDVEISAVPLRREGRQQGVLLVGRDITEVTAAMTAVAAREHRIRAIMDTVMDGIVTVDEEGNIETTNVAVARTFGYQPNELVGRNLGLLLPDVADGPLSSADLVTLCGVGTELAGRRKDGTRLALHLGVSELTLGTQRLFTGTIRDLTEHKQLAERVAYLANHDPLTDLPNRSFLTRRLEEDVARARESGALIAVLVMDLAGFTTINDSLGHEAGNAILRETANRLRHNLGEHGTAARLSADEFAIVLPNLTSLDLVHASIAQVRDSLARTYMVGTTELQVITDVGVSVYPRDGVNAADLFRNAETALHATKKSETHLGFFDAAMTTRVTERLALERSLRRALDAGQFEVFYQPQMSLTTGRILCGAALIRWRHPDLGIVGPDKFIPIAEQTGLIVPMGQWVLNVVCRQIRTWEKQGNGLGSLRYGVNISGRQFREPNLASMVRSALEQSGINPSLLELELTESMLMSDAEETLRLLRDLTALGIQIAIDDFGTGYSSLAYLKRFPVSTIKIDRAFVKDLDTDLEDRMIANAIISLARNLGMTTIAEGVETPSQAELLALHGCDEIQGYLIGKPMPAAEFSALVKKHNEGVVTPFLALAEGAR